ncbi:MAG: RES family NAD+ phosphorylase [Cognatishimia sp.]
MPNVRPYRPARQNVWRLIEGQYRPATQKIVDTSAEQEALEHLLEASKPAIPAECAHLDYQFSAPFRYGCYPHNSRFRRQGPTPGVFYASEHALTAALEAAWITVKFYRASPDTVIPRTARNHTAIQADIQVPVALDLTHPQMAGQGDWTHVSNYNDCLDLADQVRTENCELLRYQSVRDPEARANIAVLTCRAFAQPAPVQTQTWHLFFTADRVIIDNETLRQRFEYLVGEGRFEPVT